MYTLLLYKQLLHLTVNSAWCLIGYNLFCILYETPLNILQSPSVRPINCSTIPRVLANFLRPCQFAEVARPCLLGEVAFPSSNCPSLLLWYACDEKPFIPLSESPRTPCGVRGVRWWQSMYLVSSWGLQQYCRNSCQRSVFLDPCS